MSIDREGRVLNARDRFQRHALDRKEQGLRRPSRERMLSAVDAVREVSDQLGLDLENAEVAEEVSDSDPRIDALLADRQRARESKDWAAADRIRDELLAEGIELIDTPQGPRWRRT